MTWGDAPSFIIIALQTISLLLKNTFQDRQYSKLLLKTIKSNNWIIDIRESKEVQYVLYTDSWLVLWFTK